MENIIYTYILPILIVTGATGNILTMTIYCQKPLKSHSVSLYMFFYTIQNTLVLFVLYGGSWISYITLYPEPGNLSDWGCRVWQYVYRMVMHCGVWILLSMTFDRYISLYHPFKATSVCTIFMAKAVLLLIGIGVTVVSIHAMWTYELQQGHCLPLQHSLHFTIWNWVSGICLTFLPLLLLVILSFMFSMRLCTFRVRRDVSQNDTHASDLAKTVLGLSFVYITLAMPATIVNLIHHLDVGNEYTQVLMYATTFANLLSCGNQAIIFFVCFTFSSFFRSQLKNLVKCCHTEHIDVSTEMKITSTTNDIHIQNTDHESDTLL